MAVTNQAVIGDNETAETYANSVKAKSKTPIETHVRLRQPWEYRSSYAPNERRSAYERFKYYLELGASRTHSIVSEHFKVSRVAITQMASKYNWNTRIAAWEEFEALRKADEDRQQRHEEHVAKLEAFRSRSEAISNGLISASAQLLAQANASIAEMKAQGETLDRRLIASALNAAAKCSESGRIMASQALGIDALLAGLDGGEDDIEDRYS